MEHIHLQVHPPKIVADRPQLNIFRTEAPYSVAYAEQELNTSLQLYWARFVELYFIADRPPTSIAKKIL